MVCGQLTFSVANFISFLLRKLLKYLLLHFILNFILKAVDLKGNGASSEMARQTELEVRMFFACSLLFKKNYLVVVKVYLLVALQTPVVFDA